MIYYHCPNFHKAQTMTTTSPRPIQAEDLYELQTLAECEISPDGNWVVFCLGRVEPKSEKKYSNLWLVSTGDGQMRQFTYGDQTDSQPRWSPDGRTIAFLSNRADEKQPQLYLIPLGGGEAHKLTDLKGNFGSFAWSPNGTRLACQFRKKDAAELEREADEQKKKLGVVSRQVTRVFYKFDEVGFLPQARWHLWIIDAQTGDANQLTDNDTFDEGPPAWSPDGQLLAYTSNRSDDPDLDLGQDDLFLIDAQGGDERRLDTPVGRKSLPSFSPDGQWISYFGSEEVTEPWRQTQLWLIPSSGQGEAQNLTAAYDLHCAPGTVGDVSAGSMKAPLWSADATRLYFPVSHHGQGQLRSISISGDNLETVTGLNGVVGAYSWDQTQARLAYSYSTFTDPGQVWLYDAATQSHRQLTQLNQALLNEIALSDVETHWTTTAEGTKIQGWIVKPLDFDPDTPYPTIIEIHGGPLMQYGYQFMHEFHYLAAQGYVVAFANPRGGRGYGEAHARAIEDGWGNVDYADMMAWTDFVARQPYVDAEHLGVTGGSYGGYMTNWIIGQTDRFKAAVTQRSICNLISLWGAGDINWVLQHHFGNQPPWENIELFWERSPLKYVGQVKTPTLIIHSEQDHRCTIEQGEQFFVALKVAGVPTEMIRFPDESHGLSRGGRTDRRIERLKAISSWFDRYLAGDQGEGV
jgi:dipeptidyl aminopeptidase/acylaminoacyl peptidase